MEVVHEVHNTRPYLTSIVFVIFFKENVHILAHVDCFCVMDGNSDVDQRHKMQVLILD